MPKKGNHDGNKTYIEINEKGNIAHQNLYNTKTYLKLDLYCIFKNQCHACLSQ